MIECHEVDAIVRPALFSAWKNSTRNAGARWVDLRKHIHSLSRHWAGSPNVGDENRVALYRVMDAS